MEEKQIRNYFEIWWGSEEGSYADIKQKETFWLAFRAGFIRCITDSGGKVQRGN